MSFNTNRPFKDLFSGCLIGQALGDALGFPVEGYPPEICQQYVDRVLRTDLRGEIGRVPHPFGQYTDDTQLARELMQSYIEHRHFSSTAYAQRIAAIFTEGRIVGYGRATKQAATRLAAGVPWERAGTPPPAAGNGSAMRAAPIGLMFFDDPQALIAAAHDQGRITHQDPRCSAGAVAIAGAVALVLKHEHINMQQFAAQLSDWVSEIDPTFAAGIQKLNEWIALAPGEAIKPISRFGLPPDYVDHWQGISPFVVGSVLWSLYAFMRTPDNYWETICTAIAVGGDVDTTAAMAGAISGAHLGLKALPLDIAKRLTDQRTWRYTRLIDLAERCFELKVE